METASLVRNILRIRKRTDFVILFNAYIGVSCQLPLVTHAQRYGHGLSALYEVRRCRDRKERCARVPACGGYNYKGFCKYGGPGTLQWYG